MRDKTPLSPVLARMMLPYFMLTLLATLMNNIIFLRDTDSSTFWAGLFSGVVYLSYSILYLLPAWLLVNLARKLWYSRRITWALNRLHLNPSLLVGATAVFLYGSVQVYLFADGQIHRLYGFHVNGFVWNLIFTPGGISSMGGDTATVWMFSGMIAGWYVLQAFLLLVALKTAWPTKIAQWFQPRRRGVIAWLIIGLLLGAQSLAYGASCFVGYEPVLASADAFPLYMPVTFRKLGLKLGFHPVRENNIRFKSEQCALQYPLHPLTQKPEPRYYNIVWLVAESLRADMLTPEIMPHTWAFAQEAVRFEKHYSTGNGTRMGLFGMFYGIYPNYWFDFLAQSRSPVLMDLLQENQYQMSLYSSALFSYPEFDKTLFARVPAAQFHDSQKQPSLPGWQWDRQNVADMIQFIEQRDPGRPFMTFMFFESPHARYFFPPESVIRTPYLEDFNYATMDLQRDIGLIKNRYVNSCHHLDSQFGRVLDFLREKKLLESTIVVVTGDHGEEFMESGHWGHNSTCADGQVRTPLVMSIPSVAPHLVSKMTSHMDIPATLLTLLGVTNPDSDYSQGHNLFDALSDPYVVIGGWDNLAYVDDQYQIVFPLKYFGRPRVIAQDGTPVKNRDEVLQKYQKNLAQLMTDFNRFHSAKKASPAPPPNQSVAAAFP